MFLRNWYLMSGPSRLTSYNNASTFNAVVLNKDAPMLRVYNGQTLGDICTSFTDWKGINTLIVPAISAIPSNSNYTYSPWGLSGSYITFGNTYYSYNIVVLNKTLPDPDNTSGNYFIILGEGTVNDSTPVTLDDYDITNPLGDSDISTFTSSYDENNGCITVTPILTTNKTIREVGIAKIVAFCTSQTPKTGASYVTDMESDGWTLPTYTGYNSTTWVPMVFLMYKSKLQTPIQFEAGVPKTITIGTDPANM